MNRQTAIAARARPTTRRCSRPTSLAITRRQRRSLDPHSRYDAGVGGALCGDETRARLHAIGETTTGQLDLRVRSGPAPLGAGVATDLEHLLAAIGEIGEIAGEPRAVMAGTLDRPCTHAAGVAVGEAQRLRVAALAGTNHRLRQHRSRGSDNDSERVLIAVRVDTDHVHLVCKHPDRSSDSTRRVRMTSV